MVVIFYITSSQVYSSDQFLQQCQDFRERIKSHIIEDPNDPESYVYRYTCIAGGSVFYCESEKNFKSYIDTLSLEISKKEIQLYDDELLRCSFFTFHRIRVFSEALGYRLIDFLLEEYEDIKRLLAQESIHDVNLDNYAKPPRSVLKSIKLSMDDMHPIASLNFTEWPDRAELNETLNEYLTTQYGVTKNIDFIKLIFDQKERK